MRPETNARLPARLPGRFVRRQHRPSKIAAVLMALIATTSPDTPNARTTTETIEPLPAIGRLDFAGHEDAFHCTATLTASDRAITAAHCLEPPATVENSRFRPAFAALSGIEELRVNLLQVDKTGRDIAMLCLGGKARTQPMPRGVRRVALGEGLTIVGYAIPGDRGQSQTGCTVDELREDGAFVLNCPLRPGTSGAPVLRHTRTGREIVGVISATTSTQSLAYDITTGFDLPDCE